MIIGKIPDNTSKTHKRIGELLEQIVTGHRIYSEYPLKDLISEKEQLYYRAKKYKLDFYDETFGLAIEIQGKQHYEYTPFFHGTRGGFDRQRISDSITKAVCNLAGVKLILWNSNDEITEEIIRGWYE